MNNISQISMRKKVYVTRDILEPPILRLFDEYDVIMNTKSRPPSKAEILKNVRNVDGIVCMLSDKIDAEVISTAGAGLKVISSYSTGFDHIDINEATKRGIYVCFTSDILAETTADLAFALILSIARRIVEADKFVRQKRWRIGWMPNLFLGSDINGLTLGIIGLGRIGSAVARRARGFNMKILYHNRSSRNIQLESEFKAQYVDIDTLLEQSDFVSIHTTLNKESFHLINELTLKKMKRTSYIINTARGSIINELDLIKALKNNWIAGAALDTFECEPLPSSNEMLKMKNIVVLPHIGSATYQTRSKMSYITVQNLLNVLNGKDPLYLVNPEVKNIRPLA
jgi:glyoxylate reductase